VRSEIKGLFTIQYPEQIKLGLKNFFRPLFRLMFGTRKIKQSERVV